MDLNSINTNINRLLTNIWNVVSFFKEFAVDDSKNVRITYINADGSESNKTFPNIAKQISTLNNWKSDFSSLPMFTAPQGQGKVYKRVGSIRIDDSSAYFSTGINIGPRFTGFSLKINILYEKNDGDWANTGMTGYASGYIGREEITTNVYGDPDLKCKVDADGIIWVANITPPSSNQAYLAYNIEYIVR